MQGTLQFELGRTTYKEDIQVVIWAGPAGLSVISAYSDALSRVPLLSARVKSVRCIALGCT